MAVGDRIAIADKATLDAVKNKVDILGGITGSKYYAGSAIVTVNTTDNYSSVVNAQGPGYLYHVIIPNMGATSYLKITIDGTVYWLSNAVINSTYYAGVLYKDTSIHFTDTANNLVTYLIGNQRLSIPISNIGFTNITSGSQISTLVLPLPLRFKQSLKIEVLNKYHLSTIMYYSYSLD